MRFLSSIAVITILISGISLAQRNPNDTTAVAPAQPKSSAIVLAELFDGSFVPVTIRNYRPGVILPPYLPSDIFTNMPNSSFRQADPRQVRRLWTIRNSPSGARYGALVGGIVGGFLGGMAGYQVYLDTDIMYQNREIIAGCAAAGIVSGALWGMVLGHIASSGGPDWKPIWPGNY